MTESRHRILQMLADGKITVEEAERLMTAAGEEVGRPAREEDSPAGNKQAKYLHITVNAGEGDDQNKDRVNIKIPLRLIKTGMALSSLLPEKARAQVNAALNEKGIHLDLNTLNAKSVDELIAALQETNIEVEDHDDKVRIYCA
jgi:hypothetical protein